MSLFVLSDTHLSLSSGKPMEVFGPRWEGYVRRIEENWRAVVKKNDTVIVAGDVSWGMSLEEAEADLRFLDSLPGRKLLGRGNHDYWWTTKAKMDRFFGEKGFTTLGILFNNAYKIDRFIVSGTRGWYYDKKTAPEGADFQKIVAREAGRLSLSLAEARKLRENAEKEGETGLTDVAFFHFPPVFGDFVCRPLVDMLKEHGIKKVYYGHIHSAAFVLPSFEFEGMEFSITSADHLAFTPRLVR